MHPPVAPADSLLRTRALAAAMYPKEQWVQTAVPGVCVAASRNAAARKDRSEAKKLGKEITQCALLAKRGSAVFLLPEDSGDGHSKADAVIDGEVVEVKKLAGTRTTIGNKFRSAYHQGEATMRKFPALVSTHSVFLELDTHETVASIQAKLAGEIKNKTDNGTVICYFAHYGQMYCWSYAELRKMITKGPKLLDII